MSMRKTLLMTAAVIGVASFATTANAAGLLGTNSATGVSVNTPAANVGVNTNVDAGVNTRTYRKHTAARVESDGTVNTRAEDSATATDSEGNVTARHSSRVHTRAPSVEGQVDARTNARAKVYEDNYADGEQMTKDMNANDGVRAGAGVNTATSLHLNN